VTRNCWIRGESSVGQGATEEASRRRCVCAATRARVPFDAETWRTPWPAAGCNIPAGFCAEETVEAGRNGKGGTSRGTWRSFGRSQVRKGLVGVDAQGRCRRRGDLWEPQERSSSEPDECGQPPVERPGSLNRASSEKPSRQGPRARGLRGTVCKGRAARRGWAPWAGEPVREGALETEEVRGARWQRPASHRSSRRR